MRCCSVSLVTGVNVPSGLPASSHNTSGSLKLPSCRSHVVGKVDMGHGSGLGVKTSAFNTLAMRGNRGTLPPCARSLSVPPVLALVDPAALSLLSLSKFQHTRIPGGLFQQATGQVAGPALFGQSPKLCQDTVQSQVAGIFQHAAAKVGQPGPRTMATSMSAACSTTFSSSIAKASVAMRNISRETICPPSRSPAAGARRLLRGGDGLLGQLVRAGRAVTRFIAVYAGPGLLARGAPPRPIAGPSAAARHGAEMPAA